MPLPAAAGPIIDTVGNLLNSFYQNSTKTSLLEEQGHPLQAAKIPLAVMFDVPNEDPFPLPVNVTIDTRKSRLINGDLPGGRFEKDSLTEAIFANTSILIVDKPVSIVELISSSTEPRFKSTRTLLDSLAAGQDYGLDPNNRKEANKLISQNPGGIMLFLALSEAIHCQTKRRPKIKLPLQPMIFQAFTSTAASCKIAKSDCMRSLSHRIFFAASCGALPSHGRRTKPTVGPCSVGAKSLQTVYLEL